MMCFGKGPEKTVTKSLSHYADKQMPTHRWPSAVRARPIRLESGDAYKRILHMMCFGKGHEKTVHYKNLAKHTPYWRQSAKQSLRHEWFDGELQKPA